MILYLSQGSIILRPLAFNKSKRGQITAVDVLSAHLEVNTLILSQTPTVVLSKIIVL